MLLRQVPVCLHLSHANLVALVAFYGVLLLSFQSCTCQSSDPAATVSLPRILGFNAKHKKIEFDNDDVVAIPSDEDVFMSLFGRDLHFIHSISFTSVPPPSFSSSSPQCEFPISPTFSVKSTNSSFVATVHTRPLRPKENLFYICARHRISANRSTAWFYQGIHNELSLRARYQPPYMLPLSLQILLIIFLFFLSGLFSGLNLGLMSLNVMELKIVESAGSEKERMYAKKIRPIRRHGNYLLCTLLLGNVLVNTSLTLLMDNLTGDGAIAVVSATLGITLFGEIVPQAICSRFGMAVGAHTIFLTKVFMFLTAPLSFPISFLLDKILGDEMGQEYTREKLRELIKQQNEMIQQDEMNIITGALSLTTKTVHDIMTPLDKAYMISADAVLDFDTLNEIVRHGYTRVPVYEGHRGSIRSVLNVKDLAFIDPGTKTPVMTVCDFYQRPILIIDQNENLERMLRTFRQGRTHMAFVENVVSNGEGDPYREMVGLVTLEDVIEEILQAEIMDETDTYVDNQQNDRREVVNQDFSVLTKALASSDKVRLPPQLKMAALRHLLCNVTSFHEKYIGKAVLQNLLNTEIVVDQPLKKQREANQLYTAGVNANYAIFIMQGRVTVEVTEEKLLFEAGPFMFFGESMLMALNAQLETLPGAQWTSMQSSELPTFTPDYSVRACTDLQYLRITTKHYLFARTQTRLLNLKTSLSTAYNMDSRKESAAEVEKSLTFVLSTPLYASETIHLSESSRSPPTAEYDSATFIKAWNQHLSNDSGRHNSTEVSADTPLLGSPSDPANVQLELVVNAGLAAPSSSAPSSPSATNYNHSTAPDVSDEQRSGLLQRRTTLSNRDSLLV